ncbi:hypothetical protein [Oceaniglobus ichthyenteri]|uniref:hypothetical protein n=1 Tax=Oceaniglobus ichthyenteri TaxID=2136177 RepID=UPI0013DE1484|nr:hypothetical protein [Oceaniglobus ichthyenteri]
MTERSDSQHDMCQRHAAVIKATEASIAALPPLPFASTPQSFAALKASCLPGPPR